MSASATMDDITAAATWRALGTQIRVVVTEPRRLAEAERMLAADVEALDTACSRFRPDSEVRSLVGTHDAHTKAAHTKTAHVKTAHTKAAHTKAAHTKTAHIETPLIETEVSPLLAQAIAAALRAARLTDGDVDPTVGAAMSAAGYDRDFSLLAPADQPDERTGPSGKLTARTIPGWQNVHLDGRLLTMPADVQLDLGATAKAWAADRSARRIADTLDCGVLVSLGGDIAVAGEPPHKGWRIRVQDVTGDPEAAPVGPYALIAIHSGGLATSSTTARRWRRGGDVLHHILDPRTGLPAEIVWRTVSVTAGTCADANAASTAAIIRGRTAMAWLTAHNLPARLVDSKGAVFTVAGWPAPAAPALPAGEER